MRRIWWTDPVLVQGQRGILREPCRVALSPAKSPVLVFFCHVGVFCLDSEQSYGWSDFQLTFFAHLSYSRALFIPFPPS